MFLAVALTSSLFATPLIATHLDFNHAHPEGTDHHVHAINAMLVPAVAAPVMSLTASMNVVATLVLLVAIVAQGAAIDPANPARAPPSSVDP